MLSDQGWAYLRASPSLVKMTWSVPINRSRRAKLPTRHSTRSKIDAKSRSLAAEQKVQILNMDCNLSRVKLENFNTHKVYKPIIKREEHQPVKLDAPVNFSDPLRPSPHQDLVLEFEEGESSLVLTGCQQCHMYVMTLPGNDKCPNCQQRNLKEFKQLEREAAERNAAARINLHLSL